MIGKLQSFVPLYMRASIVLLGILSFFFIVYVGQNIILPLVFSVLVAILINPLVNFLILKRINKIIAIAIPLLIALALMGGIIVFFSSQFNSFTEALPQLRIKFNELLVQLVDWLHRNFNLSSERINEWISTKTAEQVDNSSKIIGSTVNRITQFFVLVLLVPVYIFLLIYYKPLLLKFISKLFPVDLHAEVVDVLREIKQLVQHYLVGLLLEMFIIAGLTSLGLFLLGIQNPVLFGVITALLNTIPYVGVLVANISFATIALITKSPSSALFVLILYIVIQFIDNNIIVPRIIGAKVKINALATILTVLIGGELCGIAGMFLAIPVTAVFKVICDHIEPLEPIGYLLGDTMPASKRSIFKTGRVQLPVENKGEVQKKSEEKKE